jgi:RNA polymerase sigma-70 factor (ECF subfamily)
MTEPQTAKDEWIGSALSHYEGPLLRYASRFLDDLEKARDVVQDTFLRLCRENPARLDGRLGPWLFTVCRNRALDVLRKEGRLADLDDADEPASPAPAPPRVLEGQEALRDVLRVLATLPASQQEVLRLKFQEELSYEQISAVTGRSVSHVGVLIHNGLKTIRTQLAPSARAGQLRRIR